MAERAERWSRGYRITSTRDIAWDLVRDAAAEVWAHRTRSALTLSGIVFGCASVVAMSSLTVWLKTTAFEEIGRMGMGRAFSIFVGSNRWESHRAIDRKLKGLTPGDLDAVRRLPGVEHVNGSARGGYLVVAGPRGHREIEMRGLDAGVIERYQWPVVRGRSLVPLDVATEAPVVMVGSVILKDLFGGMNPVGRTLTIEGARLTVVGVFAPVALNLVPADMSRVARSVVVPYTWVQRHYHYPSDDGIEVSVAADADFTVTMQSVRSTLLVRHGSADFQVFDHTAETNELLTMVAKLLSGWNVVVYAISGVTLLVGGIGLLGVLLISVRERVREIGIRKALGAGEQDILALFLAESVALALGGAAVGIAAGSGLIVVAQLIAGRFGLQFSIPVNVPGVVVSVVFAGLVGLGFGWYPARRASRLNPVEAIARV